MANILTIIAEGLIYPDEYLYEGDKGISKVRLQNQINAASADEIVIIIDSQGGQMEEGWKIVDYLLSLNKPIKTVVQGNCYSMAVALFLTGSERLISPNSDLMIHLPEYDPYMSYLGGNKYDLETYIEDLVQAEEKLLKYYVSRTGKSESSMSSLLAANKGTGTFLSSDESVSNGFATGLFQNVDQISNRRRQPRPIFAMAKYGRPQSQSAIPTNSTDIMSKVHTAVSALMNAANNLLGLAGGTKTVTNLKLAMANGTSVEVAAAGDVAAQGDLIKNEAGESLADGDHETAEGQIISVSGGAISEIKAKEGGAPTSQEPVNEEQPTAEEITNLRNEVARLQGIEQDYNDFKARTTTVVNQMQKALGQKQSADPITQAPKPKIRNQQVTEDAEGEREEMFKEREQTDWAAKRTGISRKRS